MSGKLAPLTVGVAGTGVIGRGWIKVFARAGCIVSAYDIDPDQAARARAWYAKDLDADIHGGLITARQAQDQLSRVRYAPLKSAFTDVAYVQESGPENLEVKRHIMRDLDAAVAPSAIIGSSTTALDVNDFAGHLPHAERIITAHPINPPYLHPALEVYPSRQVQPETLKHSLEILRSVGMKPVLLRRFVKGYVAARLQAALMREAIHLVQLGVTTVDGVDTMVRDGLGQRWAFLGPFGVNHTNADGGIGEYYTRYRGTYIDMMTDLAIGVPSFDPAMIEQIAEQTTEMVQGASVAELGRWRDEQVVQLRANKAKNPMPGDQTH